MVSEFWEGKKVCVSGAGGFLGKNVVRAVDKLNCDVSEGHNLFSSPIWESYNLLQYDHCVNFIDDNDIVFHCAAVSKGAAVITGDQASIVHPNILMNANMLEAAYRADVKKFVFISSSVVYPESQFPCREMDAVREPTNCYFGVGWMKRYGEKLCEFYSRLGMECLVIRPSNLFGGPFDNYDPETSHVTASIVRKVAERQDPLEVWGDGQDVRDILYIEDFVEGVLHLTEHSQGFSIYNLSYGKGYKVSEILDMLCVSAEHSPKIVYNPNKPSVLKYREIDNWKARCAGWTPKHTVEQALEKTLQDYPNRG